MLQPLPAARVFLSSRGPRKTIQNDPSACIIDGRDIICQEGYRKFLQKGRVVSLASTGESNREARSEVSRWVKRSGAGLLPRRRASRSGKRTNPVVELLIFIEPRGVEDLEAGNRPSGYAANCNFDG